MYAQEYKPATAAYKLKRRSFLRLGTLTVATGLAPLPALAGPRPAADSASTRCAERSVPGRRSQRLAHVRHVQRCAKVGSMRRLDDLDSSASIEKSVAFYNLNTGEQLRAVYWSRGTYLPGTLQAINYFLRDYHANEVKPIDPQLLDLLYTLGKLLETNEPFQILSGYRSPATNARLRHHNRAVAVNSLHIAGKAVDIRLPGRSLLLVRRAALALQAGGVGYYPRRNTLHVDTGPIRSW